MNIIKQIINSLSNIKKLSDLIDWLEDRLYAKNNDSRAIAKRVLKVFTVHDISVLDIPTLFPSYNFKISNFNTLNSTIEAITPEFMAELSKHFFISIDWLKTGKGPIQSVIEYGYNFETIYQKVVGFEHGENEYLIAYFISEKDIKFVPANDFITSGYIVVIIEINYEDEKSGFKYSRYLPLYDGYWHYRKTRMMLKATSLLLLQDPKIITQKGLFYKSLKEGSLKNKFASTIVNSSSGVWHPDDYIFCNGHSRQEKAPSDAKRMHDYLNEIGFYKKIATLKNTKFLD